LSYNRIKKIQNLPKNIQELYIASNIVDEVTGPVNDSLVHLGMAYNLLDNNGFIMIVKNFPNLFSLDVGFNKVNNLQNAIEMLEELPNLKMLFMGGNPLALLPNYRKCILQRLPNLKIMDDLQAFNEVREFIIL
jgi:Leucine-rich repeat (LRR) protein